MYLTIMSFPPLGYVLLRKRCHATCSVHIYRYSKIEQTSKVT